MPLKVARLDAAAAAATTPPGGGGEADAAAMLSHGPTSGRADDGSCLGSGAAGPRAAGAPHAAAASTGPHAAATSTVPHAATLSAGAVRVIAKVMDFHAPRAKRLLADCLVGAPVPRHGGVTTHGLTVSVEAAGSGVVLVAALQVDPDATVIALKDLIMRSTQGRVPPSDGVRLFVGHGGAELAVNARPVRAYAVPDGAVLVLVRVPSRETLLRLYEATHGLNWCSGWDLSSTAPLPKWHGVGYNGAGNVVELKLGNNGLCGASSLRHERGLIGACLKTGVVAIGKRVYH